MPKTTAELVSLLDLEEIEVGLFRGRQPETKLQRTFGGQVLAQSLMGAYRTVPDDRVLHSLSAYFLRAGRTDAPIIYDVEDTRDGGTFSARRVRARQYGRTIFHLSSSFHVLEQGLEHSDPVPSDAAPAEDCPRLVEVMQRRFGRTSELWHEWDALDVRLAGPSDKSRLDEGLDHGAHMRVWVRTTDRLPDDPRLHQAVLAYMSDMTLLSVATVPHEVVFLSPQIQSASIDHSMWFHRRFRADEWLLYDQISPSASEGLGFSAGRLFQSGSIVASCNQEGLIRVLGNSANKPPS